MPCLNNDYAKCRLTIVGIKAVFRGSPIRLDMNAPEIPPTWHAEIETLCKLCDATYYFTVDTLPIEQVGQLWRTAIAGTDYQPERQAAKRVA